MRVLVCPTAFKESMTVAEVTEAITAGVREAVPGATILRMPVSDGGPGLIDAIGAAAGGHVREHEVHGPLGGLVAARSLWVSPTAVVLETADVCGLHLVPERDRDPMRADTEGVGELVAACLAQGATDLALGLGGSATVDGGTGLARPLGYRFLDSEGADLSPGGGSLVRLARIESGRPLPAGLRVTAIADVHGPLTGPDGAARRFGPQKGAGPEQVERLEAGLVTLGDRLRHDLGREVADLPGAGSAGGLGAGCAAFLDAHLVSGSSWVLDRVGFDGALAAADLVITGEGAWDATSDLGKVTAEVLRRARTANVPALLVCGRVTGHTPPGVRIVGGTGVWLEPEETAHLVAEALG